MTDLLDRAVSKLRTLPADMQDDIAHVLLQLAGEDDCPVVLSAGEAASFAVSLAQAARGEFATEADVGAVWAKHGL